MAITEVLRGVVSHATTAPVKILSVDIAGYEQVAQLLLRNLLMFLRKNHDHFTTRNRNI